MSEFSGVVIAVSMITYVITNMTVINIIACEYGIVMIMLLVMFLIMCMIVSPILVIMRLTTKLFIEALPCWLSNRCPTKGLQGIC